jgi:hypothetical protein
MFKNVIKMNVLALGLLALVVTSCTESDSDVLVENYGPIETFEIQKNLNAGRHGCVDVVFPIEIELPDGSIIEVESFVDAKDQIQAWKEANPDVDGRPHAVFPIEVITQDGETVSVNSKDEIKTLIRECKGNFPDRPDHFRPCFRLQYPVFVEFPSGNTVSVETPRELKVIIRLWKQNHPNATERPALVYPIVIEYADGSTETINTKDELKAAKEACRD